MNDKCLQGVVKENNVVFVSNDGINFKLFLNGREMTTRGITITAGAGDDVVVSGNFLGVISNDYRELVTDAGHKVFLKKRSWGDDSK